MKICRLAWTLMIVSGAFFASFAARAEQPNDVRLPVQYETKLSFKDGSSSAAFDLAVPTGARVIVEYVSAFGILAAQDRVSLRIRTTLGNITADHYFPTTSQGNVQLGENNTIVVSGQVVRFYADPGTTMRFEGFRRSTKGEATVFVTISGYRAKGI